MANVIKAVEVVKLPEANAGYRVPELMRGQKLRGVIEVVVTQDRTCLIKASDGTVFTTGRKRSFSILTPYGSSRYERAVVCRMLGITAKSIEDQRKKNAAAYLKAQETSDLLRLKRQAEKLGYNLKKKTAK